MVWHSRAYTSGLSFFLYTCKIFYGIESAGKEIVQPDMPQNFFADIFGRCGKDVLRTLKALQVFKQSFIRSNGFYQFAFVIVVGNVQVFVRNAIFTGKYFQSVPVCRVRFFYFFRSFLKVKRNVELFDGGCGCGFIKFVFIFSVSK